MAMVVFRIVLCLTQPYKTSSYGEESPHLINIYSDNLATDVRLITVMIIGTLVIYLMCSPSVAVLLRRLQLPSPVTRPESLAFDLNGEVSSSDGRIFKYVGPNEGFVEYASTSYRNKTFCDGIADISAAQVRTKEQIHQEKFKRTILFGPFISNNIKRNSRGQFCQ